MRSTLRDIQTWFVKQFGQPESPYTKLDPEFRKSLKEIANFSMLEMLAFQLEKRYGFRLSSVTNQLLVLTVFLTSTFMLYDTITDTMVSVDKWARPYYVPGLVVCTLAIYWLIQAVRPDASELKPNPDYADDEVKQAAGAVFGTYDLKAVADKLASPEERASTEVSIGRVEESGSRTSHDREMLWRRRMYMDKALVTVGWAVVLTTIASCTYAIVGLFK